jgi:hypothetical protein
MLVVQPWISEAQLKAPPDQSFRARRRNFLDLPCPESSRRRCNASHCRLSFRGESPPRLPLPDSRKPAGEAGIVGCHEPADWRQ